VKFRIFESRYNQTGRETRGQEITNQIIIKVLAKGTWTKSGRDLLAA
jgi:hypothetical protein